MSAIDSVKSGFIVKKGAFNQFVFGNVDFNVCTWRNILHAMGGIRCISLLKKVQTYQD